MRTNTEVSKKKKKGFTLIEVIAVLVLLGILAAIALPKYLDLSDQAENRALDAGIAELNSREALAWSEAKLNGVNITLNPPTIDTNLGTDYTFDAGTLTFKDASVTLDFQGATEDGPAVYSRPGEEEPAG